MNRVRRWAAATVLSGSLAVGAGVAAPALMATPAGAQQSGLINIEITNVLNNNQVTVQVPITAAVNVCGVSVDVLSNLGTGQSVTCNARALGVNTVRAIGI